MDDILIDTLFSVMFVLLPFMALALLPHAGISLRNFSIPSFFIIFYLLSAYIGILPLYFQWDSYSLSIGVVSREIILSMFLFSSVALILIICGFIYAHHVLGFNANIINSRVLVIANTHQWMFVFVLFLVCGLILLAYINQLDAIALFKALDGDILGASVARSNMGNAFEGKYWRYHIFFRHLLDYCVIFFLADYLIRRRPISLLMFWSTFFAATFSATMAIEKGPFIKLLIMLYLSYVIYKGGNYWQWVTKYVVIMTITILVVFYIYFMGTPDITSAFQFISGRVFLGQITPSYFYLELFPIHIDYLWGTSFPNPGGLFPFDSFPLTQEVGHFIYPGSLEKGIVGSAPTVFWAEMYANFGGIGVLFSSFLVGIGLFVVSHILSHFALSAPIIAATVSLAMHYRTLTGTSLSNYFLDTTLAAIVVVTAIVLNFPSSRAVLGRPRQFKGFRMVSLNDT